MGCLGGRAGDIGIQPLNAVGQTGFGEKIQRAIGDRWLSGMAFLAQTLEDVIGPKRAMLLKQNFQYTPPHGRQAQTFSGSPLFSGFQAVRDAAGMVVVMKAGHRLRFGVDTL